MCKLVQVFLMYYVIHIPPAHLYTQCLCWYTCLELCRLYLLE
jgi:hypothetical protein